MSFKVGERVWGPTWHSESLSGGAQGIMWGAEYMHGSALFLYYPLDFR